MSGREPAADSGHYELRSRAAKAKNIARAQDATTHSLANSSVKNKSGSIPSSDNSRTSIAQSDARLTDNKTINFDSGADKNSNTLTRSLSSIPEALSLENSYSSIKTRLAKSDAIIPDASNTYGILMIGVVCYRLRHQHGPKDYRAVIPPGLLLLIQIKVTNLIDKMRLSVEEKVQYQSKNNVYL